MRYCSEESVLQASGILVLRAWHLGVQHLDCWLSPWGGGGPRV